MTSQRTGCGGGRLVLSLEQLVGLDDRLGELRHRDPAILALALEQPEGFALAELLARHENSLGALDQLPFAQRRFERVDVVLQRFELPSPGHGHLNGGVQARVGRRFEQDTRSRRLRRPGRSGSDGRGRSG